VLLSSRENLVFCAPKTTVKWKQRKILYRNFNVNTAVQEVIANVKSLIPFSEREVIEGLQSSVVNMENKICSMGQ